MPINFDIIYLNIIGVRAYLVDQSIIFTYSVMETISLKKLNEHAMQTFLFVHLEKGCSTNTVLSNTFDTATTVVNNQKKGNSGKRSHTLVYDGQ